MGEMLFWLSIVLIFFAIGDYVCTKTKAKLSAMLVTFTLFLIFFVAKIIPADIIDKSGLTVASQWAVPLLMVNMGTTLTFKQFADEWRSVVTAWLGIIAVIIGVLCLAPILGKETVLCAIPVINGALPATTIVTTAAMEKGLTLAAATATVVFTTQKFCGTPFASRACRREAIRMLDEFRDAKAKGIDLSTAENEKIKKKAESKGKPSKIKFCEKYPEIFTGNTCIMITVLFAWLSYQLGELIHLNYAIICVVVGVVIGHLGLAPKDLMARAKMKGFINMVVYAASIPSLAKISISDLVRLFVPVITMYLVSIVAIFIIIKVLPGWKVLGSKDLAFGIAFVQMLGFPPTYLISSEICNAVGETQEEKDYLLGRLPNRFVIGGLGCLVSVIVASVMVGFL